MENKAGTQPMYGDRREQAHGAEKTQETQDDNRQINES